MLVKGLFERQTFSSISATIAYQTSGAGTFAIAAITRYHGVLKRRGIERWHPFVIAATARWRDVVYPRIRQKACWPCSTSACSVSIPISKIQPS